MENTYTNNDWFATRLLNSNTPLEGLLAEGITARNSTLENIDFYRNKPKVIEAFTHDGKFDENAFRNFYNNTLIEYNYISAINTENYILDQYEKSIMDFTSIGGEVQNPEMQSHFIENPYKVDIGLGQFNEVSETAFSERELAQMNRVYNPDTGTWSNETLNDQGFFDFLFGESTIYATYDTDGTHIDPRTGQEVEHKAGEWKRDYWGNFYTETAGNRENLGKQFVTWSEVLTDDRSAWNAIDIFDSDSLEQSIPKTILRTAATAVTFLLPYIGPVVRYTTAAIQLGRALPQITKTFNTLFDENVEFDKLNLWDNYMHKFGHSVSNYSQQNLFSFENIMDMAIQSLTQLTQQRAVGELFGNIGTGGMRRSAAGVEMLLRSSADSKTLKYWAEHPEVLTKLITANSIYRKAADSAKFYSKLGEYASRGYLIATSTQDTYNLARYYGFDQQTSSIISLSTMVGVGTLFSTNYFRGMLYNSADYEINSQIRILNKMYIKNALEKMPHVVKNGLSNEGKKTIFSSIGKGLRNFFNKHVSSIESGRFGIMHGMINESLEEVSEELVADLSIQLGKGWNALKTAYTGREYTDNYSYLNTDPLKRYATAFVGGAIGGGIFKLADRLHFQKTAFKQWNDILKDNDSIMQELIILVSQGKVNNILKEWEKLENSDMIVGNISYFTGEPTEIKTETTKSIIFETFKKHITDMDMFLSQNNLKLDKSIFGDIELAKGLRASWINANGLADTLFNDYLKHVKDSVNIGAELNDLSVKLESAKDEEKKAINDQISEKNEELKFHKNAIRNILEAKDDSYIGRLMMQSNQNITDSILPDTKNSLAKRMFGRDYDNLETAFKQKVDARYKLLEESGNLEMRYYKAWNVFKNLASSKKLKTILSKGTGIIKNAAGLFGYEINNVGELSSATLNKEVDDNIAFSLLAPILSKVDFNGKKLTQGQANLLALKILGITNIPSYLAIEELSFGGAKVNKENILNSINNYFSGFTQLVEDYKNNKIDKNALVPYEYIPLVQQDQNAIDAYQSYLLEKLNSFADLSKGVLSIISVPESLKNRVQFDFIWEAIDEILLELGYENINTRNSIELLQNKRIQLGKSFKLDNQQEEVLRIITESVEVLKSILYSSYDNYSIRLNMNTRFGANNFLNEAFKEKQIPLELITLDGDSLGAMLLQLNGVTETVNDIIETARSLTKQSTSQDKKTSFRYLTQQIDQIRSLFGTTAESSILPWDKFDMNSLMMKLELMEENNPDDSFYIKNNTIMRNIVLKFEREFYNYFNQLLEGEKIDVITNIKKQCENDNTVTADTSNLSVKNDILFTSVDLFHYLMRTSLDNQKKIADVYKEYHDSLTSKCPFDTQEIIITQALQLLYNNKNALKPWIDSMEKSIDENSKLTVTYNIIKLICFGGTGKSSTILPAIYFGIQRLFSDKKCHFVANTDNQKDNLTANMQLSDKNSRDLEGELIEGLLKTLGNDSEFKNKYADSIIFIDECTNISQEDWLKLDKLCEKYNVKIIAAGDTSQVGEQDNIDKVIGMTTSQLQDSKRTFSDIMTMNMLFWERMQTGDADSIEYSNEKLFELLYYKEQGQPFEGIYFENPDQNVITGEYLEAFLNMHPLPETLHNEKEHNILIFTSEKNDKVLSEKYAKGYNGYEITIVSGKNAYKTIQGAEWDYVFSDVDLNVPNVVDIQIDPELIKNENGTENRLKKILLQKEVYHDRVKEIYTLVSRARHGFISFKSMTYGVFESGNSFTVGYNQNNKQSTYPPVDTGISPDIITNYKDYKAKILEGLIYEDDKSTKVDQDSGRIQPPTILKTFDAMNMVQCSPGFVWRDDAKLVNNFGIKDREHLDRMKMIITQALTENDKDLLKKLPSEWQNGEFLIKFQKTSGGNLEYLGNWGRNNKNVALLHPWLVYSIKKDGERVDIHLGMFHNEKGVKIMPLDQTEPTLKLNKLHDANSKGPIYHQIDFTKIQFRRSRNPISIQNETNVGMHESSLIYENGKITSVFGDQSYSYINSSVPIYIKKGDNSIVNVEYLTQVLSEQGKLYTDIFKYLVESGLYQGNEIHNILEIIGTSREIDEDTGKVSWKAREPIPVENEFISFIKLNVEDNNLDLQNTLKQWSAEYIAEQEAFNKQLKEIISIAKNSNLSDNAKKTEINKILSNRVISRVSLLIYRKEYISNVNELNDALSNINNNGGNKNERQSYNQAIAKQLWNVFRKCWFIANKEDIKNDIALGVIEGIKEEDVDKILEIINKYKSDIESQIKRNNLPKENWLDINPYDQNVNLDNIISFIASIQTIYEKIYDFKSKNNLASVLSNITVNNKSDKRSVNPFKILEIKTYPKLLKDNGLVISNSGITIVDKTLDLQDARLSMSDKIVQPGQIHMYVEGSVKSALPEVSSNNSSEIVKPIGVWKRTVQSRDNNPMMATYTSETDEDGYVHITFIGTVGAAFRFNPEGKNNPDFFIGNESDYQSVESYNEVKEDFLSNGIKIFNIHIRPDGTISIENDLHIEIPQEAARVIYDAFINESDFKSEPVDPDPFIDPAQNSDFKGILINRLGLNPNVSIQDIKQKTINEIHSIFENDIDGETLDVASNYIQDLHEEKAAEVIYYFLTGDKNGIDSLDEGLKNNIYTMMGVLGLNDEDLKNYIEC